MGKKLLHLPRQDIAEIQSLLHTLRKFRLCLRAPLDTSSQFIEKQQRLLRLKVVQKTCPLTAEIGQIRIHPRIHGQLLPLLGQFIRHGGYPVGFLCLHLFSQLIGKLFCLLLQTLNSFAALLFRQHQLTGRINRQDIQILNGFLALHIERTYRINLISPQFDTGWYFVCQRKNIQDAAAERKLPHGIHLIFLLISHVYQTADYFAQINGISRSKPYHAVPYLLRRCHRIHERIKGRNQCHALLLMNGRKCQKALGGQQISLYIRLIEQYILRRIIHDSRIVEFVIFVQFLRFLLMECDNELIFSSAAGIDHVRLLCINTARHTDKTGMLSGILQHLGESR